MMTEQKNIPGLRFPEFNGEWEKKKIIDFAPLQRGFDLPVNKIREGKYPVVFSNGILKYHNEYKVEGPGVVTGRSGTIGNVTYVEDDFWAHNTALWVTDFKGNHPKYVYYFYWRFNLEKLATGSGVPTLNRNDIHVKKDYFPSLPEQQKIASFLTAIDKKISKLKKKKSLLEQYKKGVMQKIFSQEIRFRDENGEEFPEWEKKRLGDVLFEHLDKNSDNEFSEVFSVAKEKGVINQIEHLGRSFAAKSISHYKLIHPHDIVYTKSPTADFPFGIIKQNMTGRTGVVSPLYGVFKPETNELGFLLHNYFLSWVNTYNYLKPLVQKGAKNTMNINNHDFLNGVRLPLPPSVKEQKKIVAFIQSVDNKINLTHTQIEKAELWKKGLLQKMFV